MSKYTIIEDASPFYVRFTFNGLSEIINFILKQDFLPENCRTYFGVHNEVGYTHCNFTKEIGETIVKMLPMSDLFEFKTDRVAVFSTPPNGGCGVHKDGQADKVSFNITIEVNDDRCITNWYDDKDFNEPDPNNLYSRNVYKDFTNLDQFNPINTMIARPNEMIIFNTDMYHSWQNKSEYTRKVLTLRTVDRTTLTYNEVKNKLFE
jgi:hypothetical protein